jgi:hypothetical protein
MVFDIFGDAWVRFVSFDTRFPATKFVPFVPNVPKRRLGLFFKILGVLGKRGKCK